MAEAATMVTAPRVLILRTAGTNCDQETKFAFERAKASVDLLHVNALVANPSQLNEYAIFVLPGGFSYGDDLGAGRVLANELKMKLGETLQQFVEKGRLVLGICNGFQVLVKTGLLPGGGEDQQRATLTFNDSHRFEDRWVHLRIGSTLSPFFQEEDTIYLPVAHGEGKFVPRDDAMLQSLIDNKQIVAQYVDPEGNSAGYPHNPNGSTADIAAICDPTGRVLGMMPHPERHVLPIQHPRWTREGLKPDGDGATLFLNAVNYAQGL